MNVDDRNAKDVSKLASVSTVETEMIKSRSSMPTVSQISSTVPHLNVNSILNAVLEALDDENVSFNTLFDLYTKNNRWTSKNLELACLPECFL